MATLDVDVLEESEGTWHDEDGEPAPSGDSRFGAIYFVLDIEDQALKVGTARNVNQRLWQIQCGNPRNLVFIGWIHGSLDEEAKVHESMPEQKIRGEWYRVTPEILAMVRSVCATNRDRVRAHRRAWEDYVKANESRPASEIARSDGVMRARAIAASGSIVTALEQSLALVRGQ